MWATITFVSIAVCCLVFLPDTTQGRKRVIIKVPYIIKHVHHHHVKKVHIDKYHTPKEYHFFHKPTYNKKRPVYHAEFDHGHDWVDFGKGKYGVWHKKNTGWRKRNQKRRHNRVKHHNYGHEQVLEGSNQVSYKTEADWREGRKENVKNETKDQQTITQEVEQRKPYPVHQINELAQQLPVSVPNLNPQVFLTPLVPQALPFAMPNLNFGIYPTNQNQPLPLHLNPGILKNQQVENIQQVIGGQQDNNKPAWVVNKPAWEQNKPVWEPNKPAWEQNKPVWELNKPVWEENKPVEESKNPGWETLNSWSDATKDEQKSPAYSYSVRVVH